MIYDIYKGHTRSEIVRMVAFGACCTAVLAAAAAGSIAATATALAAAAVAYRGVRKIEIAE